MITLFWDIDGTLLTTGRAGMIAWNQAVKEQTGRDFDLKTAIRSPGLTDFQIAVRTFEVLGLETTEAGVGRLVARYEELLPDTLPLRQGRVLDNVREILDHLRATREDVQSLLLTGNTRGGARAKLTYYGLAEYLSEGAFCEDAGPRANIARRALALAGGGPEAGAHRVLVVGDTPHDIDCANAIAARTIAVATGGYDREELTRHRPWRVFDRLPDPRQFEDLLDAPDESNAATPPGDTPPA